LLPLVKFEGNGRRECAFEFGKKLINSCILVGIFVEIGLQTYKEVALLHQKHQLLQNGLALPVGDVVEIGGGQVSIRHH